MTSSPLVDLRSDTVTVPDEAMRAAMAAAAVGDDVLEGDPTVRHLEERTAELLGKPAGLFVPSGTMANLVAHMAHRTAGRAIACGPATHVRQWEGGGHAVVTGAALAVVPEDDRGVPEPDALRARCLVDDPHQPLVALAWVENSHGGRGGLPVTAQAVADVRAAVPPHVPLHLDGARLLNAAVALDTTMADLATSATTATLCLSKGLGCPVGSVLAGPEEVVHEARRARKVVGGAMRQAGILAAAGVHVLEGAGWEATREAIARSHDDAARLATALAELPRATAIDDGTTAYDPGDAHTNLVRFGVRGDRDEVVARLADQGVLVLPYGEGIRAVTHRSMAEGATDAAVAALRRALA